MTRDEDKTNEQLISELHELRGRLVELDSNKTDQTSAKQALLESEERYRAFLEEGPDGVVVLNPETGQSIEFNNQVCQQLGIADNALAFWSSSEMVR